MREDKKVSFFTAVPAKGNLHKRRLLSGCKERTHSRSRHMSWCQCPWAPSIPKSAPPLSTAATPAQVEKVHKMRTIGNGTCFFLFVFVYPAIHVWAYMIVGQKHSSPALSTQRWRVFWGEMVVFFFVFPSKEVRLTLEAKSEFPRAIPAGLGTFQHPGMQPMGI